MDGGCSQPLGMALKSGQGGHSKRAGPRQSSTLSGKKYGPKLEMDSWAVAISVASWPRTWMWKYEIRPEKVGKEHGVERTRCGGLVSACSHPVECTYGNSRLHGLAT